jgi:hypothetical protein
MKGTAIKIHQYFEPVIGLRPLRVKLGLGSFLTFEFGPRSKSHGHLCARWRLWIYLSNWSLSHRGHQLVDSDSERRRINIVAHRLEEEARLTGVEFDPRSRRTTFLFNDFRLVVSPADYLEDADEQDDYWIFFMPNDQVLAVCPSGIHTERPDALHAAMTGKKQEESLCRQKK